MPRGGEYDAVVVGTGPNGLAAAVRLAQRGLSVLAIEQARAVGGGARTAELTLPGFHHDLCSAVHPLAIASPFFSSLPLPEHGLRWIHPLTPMAHPLPGGRAVLLQRNVRETARGLGPDSASYLRLIEPLHEVWPKLVADVLRPMLHFPTDLRAAGKFGRWALLSARRLAFDQFHSEEARALFAGLAAHSFLGLGQGATGGFGLVLALAAHDRGWPMPEGGAQALTNALCDLFRELRGEVVTGVNVNRLDQLPRSELVMLDVSPKSFVQVAGGRLSWLARRRYLGFPRGPGVFKLDYALSGPIPWAAPECRGAGVVHVGGTFEEIELSEDEVRRGREPTHPFVLVAQPTLFDRTRAPRGYHVAWAYCHVPNGSSFDMTIRIEEQIERFAPGFRDCILARHASNCEDMEATNPNYLGGDISGGSNALRWLVFRPVVQRCPYRTPVRGVYLCSASTPPGGGVHGMCGFHAAEAALAGRDRR